jgi:hypothetical protein
VQRRRVVDLGADAGGGEVRAQAIAGVGAHDEVMVDVARVVGGDAHLGQPGQRGAVAIGAGPARGGPRRQVRQLGAEDRGLQRVEPEVAADRDVVVLGPRAVVAQERDPIGQRGIVGEHRAAVAAGAEVLGREERQRRRDAAHRRRADGLGRVLDDRHADRRPRRRAAEQVDQQRRRVRGPTAAATAWGSALRVASTSANTGRAPTRTIARRWRRTTAAS